MATDVHVLSPGSDQTAESAATSTAQLSGNAEESRERGADVSLMGKGVLKNGIASTPMSVEVTAREPRHSSEDSGASAVVSVEDGDLEREVVVSDSQGSPTFNVETSTTDSGVSNASSVTSDFVGISHLLPTSAEGNSLSNGEPATLPITSITAGDEAFVLDRGSAPPLFLCDPSGVDRAMGWLDALDLECRVTGSDRFGRFEGSAVPPRSVSAGVETPSDDSSSRCSSSMDCESRSSGVSPTDIRSQLVARMKKLSMGGEREGSPGRMARERLARGGSLSGKDAALRSFRSVFRKPSRKRLSLVGGADHTSQTIAATPSTTGLILQERPRSLPAKAPSEEKRHQKLYQEMVAAARRKELQRAKREVQREQERRQKDDKVADLLKDWSRILPNWEALHKTRKVRELWWHGLPPGVRGDVWRKAIGNDLNISPELYQISLTRCKERLAAMDGRARSDSSGSQKSLSREHSVEVIHLDVLRTFPTLGFFQEGGPYNATLHDVLGAYACYRPDVGYVQGMSFLAAVLLLNMEAADAFICLANLLNRPSYLAFFKVDHALMRPYFDTFNILLQEGLPKLSAHFIQLEFSPEYYLIEWIFTIYTRALPLDIACRVWDMFCRDGDTFLFRTALGILRMFQLRLLECQTIEEVGQFLGKLPPDMDSNALFQNISAINLTSKKFTHILQQHIKH